MSLLSAQRTLPMNTMMALLRRIQKYFLPILSAFVVVNFLSFFIYYSPAPVNHSLAQAPKIDQYIKITDAKLKLNEGEHREFQPDEKPNLVRKTKSDVTIINETIDLSNVYPQEQEDKVFPLMDNPWIHADDDKALSSYPHTALELRGCPYRQFQNKSVLGKMNFVTREYTRYKLCQNSKEDWLQSNIFPDTGDRGELLLETNFVFDIRPATGHFCPNSFSADSQTSDTQILFIVLSRTNRFAQRNSIRKTWGSASQLRGQGHRLVFLVGTHSHTSEGGSNQGQDGESIILDSKIRDEARLHGDILRTQAREVGPNFALEQYVIGLAWAYRECSLARYVTFASDQTFINLTGVAALAAGVMRIGIHDFFVDSVPNDEDECSFAKHGGINNVETPEVMAHIWKDVKYVLHEKNVTCVIKAPCMAEMNGKCLISAPEHKKKRDQKKQ